jgi:uncharacterized membrane protein YfcA
MSLALIICHAAAGTGAFAVGLAALRPGRARDHPWLLPLLVWLLVAMLVSVAGAMASHWNDLAGGAQATFMALLGLGLYMLHRARQAQRSANSTLSRDRRRYFDSLRFVVIALFDAFVVVTALDLGAPPWLVAALAVAAVAVGHHRLAPAT